MNISFKDFYKFFNSYVKTCNSCIEVEFSVKNDVEYNYCWLGKLNEVFWFGLVPDGSQAYQYENFNDFVNAKVFKRKSLIDIWNQISINSIFGIEPDETISIVLNAFMIFNERTAHIQHRGFSNYCLYNLVGFNHVMQEHIRIARHIPSGRLICIDNLFSCAWAHPEEINTDKWLNDKDVIDVESGSNRFMSAYKQLGEVDYTDIVAAGWDKYIICKKLPPEYTSNDNLHNMYWLRDKYNFFNATVRQVTLDGDSISIEMENVYDKNGNCDIIKDHILLDRLILTFKQAVVRSVVVKNHACLVRAGNNIIPQSTEYDISDKEGLIAFFKSITPIYIRDFQAEREDTATFFAHFSDKKTLTFTLSCDEIGNIVK